MRCAPTLHLALLLLVAIGLLWARVGGTHLHMCLDDCGTGSHLHLNTSTHHAEHHAGDHAHGHDRGHQDVDLPLFDHLLSKTVTSAQDLPLWLPVLLAFALIVATPSRHPRGPHRNVHAPPPFPLRPPLRGPPNLTS